MNMKTNIKMKLVLGLMATALTTSAFAQTPDPVGGVVASSEPGKAAIAAAVEITAEVVGLDKATRTVTLKGPEGNVVDVVAGDEVKNFDQIALGDFVVARYIEALTLELKKMKGDEAEDDVSVSGEVAKALPGEKPAVGAARQITVLADVVAVDPKESTITLKGPGGNVVVLDVRNPAQFEVVEVGDKVEATYSQALALSVEPAPAKSE